MRGVMSRSIRQDFTGWMRLLRGTVESSGSDAAPIAPRLPNAPRPGGHLLLWAGSFAASAFPMVFARVFWPQGLSAGTETLFWPATAVHVAGLWRLGFGAWPAVLAGTFLSQLCLGRPWAPSAVNALGNLAEAVALILALRLAGVAGRPLRTLRGVLVFLGAALFAPLFSSVPGAATLCVQGRLPWTDYWSAVGVWSFANATSIVLLAPFLLTAGEPSVLRRRWSGEVFAWLAGGLIVGGLGFNELFRPDNGVNPAFLAFPFVLYAAVRFGVVETATALLWVMALIYVSITVHAPEIEPENIQGTLRFLQVFAFVLGVSGLLPAALTAVRQESEARLRQERELLAEARQREERARLDALRYQIQPHFLFNSLNSIRAVSSEASRDMITELSEYFRSTLTLRDADRGPLRDELRLTRHYLAIEQMRHGEALRCEICAEEAALGLAVPLFALQPLAENAVRHGFERSREPFLLQISARLSGGVLRVEVANTGCWRVASPACGTGLGLENVRRRLALVYGDAASFRVAKEPGRVRVVLEMPGVAA